MLNELDDEVFMIGAKKMKIHYLSLYVYISQGTTNWKKLMKIRTQNQKKKSDQIRKEKGSCR